MKTQTTHKTHEPVEEITFAELFASFGIDSFEEEQIVDVSDAGYEVESWDEKTQQPVWKLVEALVVKQVVDKHYRLGSLKGTSVHKVLHEGNWVQLKDHPEAILVNEAMQVVDMMVEGTQNYIAEGQVNHNTTPGGMAIPYHASVRLKLTGGQQIKQTINGKEAVIGINVNVKTIKNKVARPWREVSFEIHFGKGIKESEQLFDELREFCEKSDKPIVTPDGKRVKVEGMGSWKVFSVTDTKTGEIIHEVKFYKSEFENKVLNVEEFKPYVTFLMDATFIMTNGEEPHKTLASIDMSSAAEVEAVERSSDKMYGGVCSRTMQGIVVFLWRIGKVFFRWPREQV
jgi:hypothetical protein